MILSPRRFNLRDGSESPNPDAETRQLEVLGKTHQSTAEEVETRSRGPSFIAPDAERQSPLATECEVLRERDPAANTPQTSSVSSATDDTDDSYPNVPDCWAEGSG